MRGGREVLSGLVAGEAVPASAAGAPSLASPGLIPVDLRRMSA